MKARDATPVNFLKSRRLEQRYARELRSVAAEIGRIVATYPPMSPGAVVKVKEALDRYAKLIGPWANASASRILTELDRQDYVTWMKHSKLMSKSIKEELANASTGEALKKYLGEHVKFIKSLPTEAGERVHKLTLEGLGNASRAKDIAREILRTGHVTASRATLIARTEIARTASGLTQVRAQFIGCEGYIWRTSQDTDVRDSHAKMAGRYVRWDAPPTLDGMVGHAGCFPNCRCYPEPVIPDLK